MKKIKINLSLKKKWMLSTGIVIFLSYTAICIVIYLALYTWLIHHEEIKAVRTADDLTSYFNDQDHSFSIIEFQENIGLLKMIVHQNQTIRIFNLDGYEVLRINDYSPSAKIDASLLQFENTVVTKEKLDGNDVFVIERLVQIGNFTGILQLIHPLNTFQSMMRYVLTAMVIAGVGALFIAMSISYTLANLLMKPLKDLRDSMAQVKEKGFQEDIHFTYHVDDEIGDLLKIYWSMMEELQTSFIRQQQFVSDASHELRTPIQAIEGHLSLIMRWGKDDPKVLDESLNTALDEVKRMKKMIEELLDLARKVEKEEAYSDVEKVLKSVTEELEVVYPNVTINIETMGDKRMVPITEHALAQIARNIIENGICYNDKDPIINIYVKYFTKDIIMTIQDNGIGIKKEHLPFIFDRFYRIDPSRSYHGGGTGLGLSITKMLAEKYGIGMDVASFVGEGTTFTLRFST